MATKKTKQRKKTTEAKKKTLPPKQGIKIVKAHTLSPTQLRKLSFDDLWVMRPSKDIAGVRARYCGCRNVCLV